MTALDIIVQFVEGKMVLEEFQKELQSNGELIELLSKNVAQSTVYYSGGQSSLYEIAQRENINSIAGHANILGDLRDYLKAEQIEFKFNEEPLKLLRLVHDVMPMWLNVPAWYMDKLLKDFEGQSGKERKDFMKAKIREDFKCLKRPPRWIQDCIWPIKNGTPLIFVGQLELDVDTFHDKGAVYVFLDTESGEIETVQQFY